MTEGGVIRSRIDVSSDVGETLGRWALAGDLALLEVVSTVHVACGFHAGDPSTMITVVRAAAEHQVAVGAHPSYPDLVGFGRRELHEPVERIVADLLYQVGALDALATSVGTRVRSVKPHGALYHRMATDRECAEGIARALRSLDDELILVVEAGSAAFDVARDLGVPVVAEAFCDRAYRPDGRLVPRGQAGAVITDPEEAAHRAISLARDRRVTAVDGSVLTLEADSLCVHGDTDGAVEMAKRVVRGLRSAAVAVESFTRSRPDNADQEMAAT